MLVKIIVILVVRNYGEINESHPLNREWGLLKRLIRASGEFFDRPTRGSEVPPPSRAKSQGVIAQPKYRSNNSLSFEVYPVPRPVARQG